jgi:cytochrome b pre-mRNA-processing protein 3
MLGALRQLFTPKPPSEAEETYIALLRAARNPFFFDQLKVPDTIDGRFELIVLHMFLIEHRLVGAPVELVTRSPVGEPEQSERGGAVGGAIRPPREALECFAQFLSEAFFNDMDSSLREMGVADTGVSKRIKKMGKAYHGCLQAYATSLNDATALRAALARNVYGTVENGDVAALTRLGNYVEAMVKNLATVAPETITSGNYEWPDVATLVL